MIKNFIANGCSFTEYINHPDGITKTWATYLAEELSVENHINLASSGAGNDYICNGTINYLESNSLDPENTLVIIMWSGPNRIDLPMSQDWYQHLKFNDYPACKTDGTDYWINSTGMQWNRNSTTRRIFEYVYKISDHREHCMKSLRYFIFLEAYLKQRGYQFLFTNFVNCWNTEQKYNPVADGEVNIGYYCKDQPMFKNFDFSNWFFINDNRDTICEFSWDPVLSQGDVHPRDEMHQRFAREILLPIVEKFV
jgi:hypothetical protein